MKVTVYNCNFYKIGGIETFIKNFVKRMNTFYDLEVIYESGDYKQLLEVSKYAELIKFNNQQFETDICIWVSGWGRRPIQNIKAKQHWQMIHADYKNVKERLGFNFEPQEEVTGYICVGQAVADTFKDLYGEHEYVKGKPIIVIHNLLDINIETEKVLNLIIVSRIGKEKGFDRSIRFVDELKQRNKKFYLHIFGDIPDVTYKNLIMAKLKDTPEAIFMGTRLDIHSFIANADYLLQFSDTEAFCYSIYEALQVNTPCIVTAFPSAYEQIKEGKSGYILPFKLFENGTKEQWDEVIDKIYNHIPSEINFKELSTEEDWIKLIGKPSKTKTKKKKEFEPDTVQVKILKTFFDNRLRKNWNRGQTTEFTYTRYLEILEAEKRESENRNQPIKLIELI